MLKQDNPLEFVIAGGLGNQLFMLCAALYYSEKFNRQVTFDISDLERVALLHPGLNVYELGLIHENQISKGKFTESAKGPLNLPSRAYARIVRHSTRFFSKTVFLADEIGFINLEEIPPATKRVEGYFQSWRYFSGLNQKPELSIKSIVEPTDWFIKQLELAKERNFAAFHIRRGDYADPTNRVNGILSMDYFLKVSKLIPADLEIIVFTDSPREVSIELGKVTSRFKVIYPPIDSDPVESMILMAQASHISISNSTFSWWAANLATQGTTVFTPSKWFELRDNPIDLLPDGWIKVQSEWKK